MTAASERTVIPTAAEDAEDRNLARRARAEAKGDAALVNSLRGLGNYWFQSVRLPL